MATNQGTIHFLLDQLTPAGDVSARKMFGEYGIYYAGKMVALVCDEKLYLKPTLRGRAYLGDVLEEGIPYPNAKPHFYIPGDLWEDGEWLSELIKITSDELPIPVKKTKKK